MELTKKSINFIKDRFGYTPVRTTRHNEDGTQSITYLMPSRNGMEPWGIQQIEEYVSWMTGGAK